MTTKTKRITRAERLDWRNLPTEHWNVLTVHTYFADMNRDKFGVEEYVPMRNWGFEQAQIKRAIDRYGPDTMREVFEACFNEYRPTAEYPQLTAGFVISYMMSRVLPRVLAERQSRLVAEEARKRAETMKPDDDEVIAWL